MEVKQISDSTIKITIKLDDLEERGMELADFLMPQEKTEEFFYSILDELDMPEHFRQSGMLSFRVTPKPDKLDIFVTKSEIDQELDFEELADLAEDFGDMSPDEFFKNLEKTLKSKSGADEKAVAALELLEEQMSQEEKKESEPESLNRYIYFTLVFASLPEVLAFVRTIDYEVDTSELYKLDGRYYMTLLLDFLDQEPSYIGFIHSRILEHADDTGLTRAVLQEHGQLILQGSAITSLQKVDC